MVQLSSDGLNLKCKRECLLMRIILSHVARCITKSKWEASAGSPRLLPQNLAGVRNPIGNGFSELTGVLSTGMSTRVVDNFNGYERRL